MSTRGWWTRTPTWDLVGHCVRHGLNGRGKEAAGRKQHFHAPSPMKNARTPR